jgi:hypothetical protein
MAEDNNFLFENIPALEEDIKRLSVEVQNYRNKPEMKDASEKELLKEAIRAFPNTENTNVASQANVSTQQQSSNSSFLPDYAEDAPVETKLEIEYLIDCVFKDGIQKALKEASKSPFFVQDAFHDALVKKLYPELKKRGIVK